jgi:hypothetical protein
MANQQILFSGEVMYPEIGQAPLSEITYSGFFQISATFAAPGQRSTLRPDHEGDVLSA